MASVRMYLEGPGRERRLVTQHSTEEVQVGSMGFAFRGPSEQAFQIKVLRDSQGNLAWQTDREGLRFRYRESDVPWALVVG